MIYVTSDFHFNHQKPFIYEPRGFTSPKEMNEALIRGFNALVTDDDDVYILGDMILGGSEMLDAGLALLNRLHGSLHLVRGNHDSDKRWAAYKTLKNVVELENSIYLKYNGFHFYLSHFPSATSNYDDAKGIKHRTINLCGHTHTKDPFANWLTGSYHCEVDAHENYPISIDDIINDITLWRPAVIKERRCDTCQKSHPACGSNDVNGICNVYKPIDVDLDAPKFRMTRCPKCVNIYPFCGHEDFDGKCPKYKRDPPDGGFYG